MKYILYLGTYTQNSPEQTQRAQGIYQFHLDADTGQLAQVAGYVSGPNPSYLALHPDHKTLYAVNETAESTASAFRIDPANGGLTLLNRQPTNGVDACYVSLDPTRRWLLTANYTSGSLAVFPIQADGALGPRAAFVQHQGSSIDPARQAAAHAHSILFDPGKHYAVAADLGMDRVWVYQLDEQTGQLRLNNLDGVNARAGAGPRHPAFHPNGRFLYISNELDSTVAVYAWDSPSGALRPLQTLSTLPADFQGENYVADIHLTPAGNFLYVSNRGHNSLAAYRVNAESGLLEAIGFFPSGGDWPRNFAIDPAGRLLVAANQNSSNLVVYQIGDDGRLAPTGEQTAVPAPVCVLFAGSAL